VIGQTISHYRSDLRFTLRFFPRNAAAYALFALAPLTAYSQDAPARVWQAMNAPLSAPERQSGWVLGDAAPKLRVYFGNTRSIFRMIRSAH
jgi:hypothetical protein